MASEQEKPNSFAAAFRSTQWSLVLRAGDSRSVESFEALEELCQRYWYPLYSFARRSGRNPHDAQDVTQGFFAKLLEKGYVKLADRNKGRFRTFMLKAFKGFTANEWDRERAQKRGGAKEHVPLDWEDAEERFQSEPKGETDPEMSYDKRWALTLIERVYQKLEAEYRRIGKAERYLALKDFLLDDPDSGAYQTAAQRLGLSNSGVRSSVMRLRQRFREMLRDEVVDTVEDEAAMQDEFKHLLKALSS